MALSLRDVAYAVLLAVSVYASAHVIDRVAYGIEMTKRGLTGHDFGGNR